MKNVIIRSISGIVYIALIILSILGGAWWFGALIAAFAVMSVYELSNMTHQQPAANETKKLTRSRTIDCVFAAIIPLTAHLPLPYIAGPTAVIAIYLLVRFIEGISDKSANALADTIKSVFSVIYVTVPLYLLNILYLSDISKTLTLVMFITIWLNDTGAFCFGSTLGKHRLCERLSPKKSWEGFWGGFFCCLVFGAVCYFYINEAGLSIVQWLILTALISIFSTLGDLFESMIKRTMHVKDSGTVMPGHGGILDRIDSLLFVAPVTAIFYILVAVYG